MQEQDDGGSIVNIASVSGIRPSPNAAAYGAAKAGLLNLTQTLAVEWAPKVRVNAVTAGLMRTEQAHLYYGDDAAHRAPSARPSRSGAWPNPSTSPTPASSSPRRSRRTSRVRTSSCTVAASSRVLECGRSRLISCHSVPRPRRPVEAAPPLALRRSHSATGSAGSTLPA